MLITIIEISPWSPNAETKERRWQRKKTQHDIRRIVTTGSIGISQRRREDWLRAAKQMDKKSKEMSVDSEIMAFKYRERGKEREEEGKGCVGSS
jgi:hypothetical protein